MEVVAELESGREAYGRQAWRQAHEALTVADRSARLGPSDLELLATSAYMLGREQEYREVLERAYRAYLDAEEPLAAVRCAHWIAVTLAVRGELGHAGGWLGRAERLLEREGSDRVERGYLLIPRVIEHEAHGELERAAASAAEAAAIGERFGDPDLSSLAAHAEGSLLISLGRLREGFTKRELEVLRLLCAGGTKRQIATNLVVSVRTVDRHVSNMYAKLGVSYRVAATTYAREHGLI